MRLEGPEQVTVDTEQVEDEPMHRQESLRVGGGFEPTHLSRGLSSRLARHFRPMVLALP
jgi:hypothetical protein